VQIILEFKGQDSVDHPLLEYMLRKLAADKREADSWNPELVESELQPE
jgi:hypothetical protein